MGGFLWLKLDVMLMNANTTIKTFVLKKVSM